MCVHVSKTCVDYMYPAWESGFRATLHQQRSDERYDDDIPKRRRLLSSLARIGGRSCRAPWLVLLLDVVVLVEFPVPANAGSTPRQNRWARCLMRMERPAALYSHEPPASTAWPDLQSCAGRVCES